MVLSCLTAIPFPKPGDLIKTHSHLFSWGPMGKEAYGAPYFVVFPQRLWIHTCGELGQNFSWCKHLVTYFNFPLMQLLELLWLGSFEKYNFLPHVIFMNAVCKDLL